MSKEVKYTYDEDIQKNKELDSLMEEWKEYIRMHCKRIFLRDAGGFVDAIECFCPDGFYPGYFKPGNQRILFVGREARGLAGCDYIKGTMRDFNEKMGGCNNTPLYRRMFYILYGLRHQGIPFDGIPYAHEIQKEMEESNDYGFAFMNISKYSNDSETSGTADYDLINRSLLDSDLGGKNFIRKELELLDPDIIFTLNLWNGKIDQDKLNRIFPNDDFTTVASNKHVALYDFKLGQKTVRLFDIWHLSAPGSDDVKFYTPIMELFFKKQNTTHRNTCHLASCQHKNRQGCR